VASETGQEKEKKPDNSSPGSLRLKPLSVSYR